MNEESIDEFLENMTLESEKEIKRIRDEGEDRVRRYRREAEDELVLYIGELNNDERKYIEETVEMEKNRWSLEYRRRELQFFEVFLNKQIDDAVKNFRTFDRDDYIRWMMKLFCDILDETGAEPMEIVIATEDMDMHDLFVEEYTARGGKTGNCTVSSSVAVSGGMRVRCIDRPVEYDGTVERILARFRETIRFSVREIVERKNGSMVRGDGRDD